MRCLGFRAIDLDAEPGRSGTAIRPPLILSGSFVNAWPSCQIQCVSIAATWPGAVAPTSVNIASEKSKWLLEYEPEVRPLPRQVCARRTEPCMVQKCGSASGMSTVPSRTHAKAGTSRSRSCGAAELGHDLAAGKADLGAAGIFCMGEDAMHVLSEPDRLTQRPGAVWVECHPSVREALGTRRAVDSWPQRGLGLRVEEVAR